jgi:hypothetical protein
MSRNRSDDDVCVAPGLFLWRSSAKWVLIASVTRADLAASPLWGLIFRSRSGYSSGPILREPDDWSRREADVPDRGGGRRSMAKARALNDGLSTDLERRISIRRGRSRARHSLRPHKLVVPLADWSRAGVAKVVQVDPVRLPSAQSGKRRDDCYREGDRPDFKRNIG